MCKYCEEIKFWENNPSRVLEEGLFIKKATNDFYAYKEPKGGIIVKTFSIKLNYCPMCGRKLGGSND